MTVLMRVRGAHGSIEPGVQRAKRANPRVAIQEGFQPAERATDLECGGNPDLSGAIPLWVDPMIQSDIVVPTGRDYAGALHKAVTRSAGSFWS